MRIVYILQSTKSLKRHYVGTCNDIKAQLQEHNLGYHEVTVHDRPWKVRSAFYIDDDTKAELFKRYLTTVSGREFLRRHL